MVASFSEEQVRVESSTACVVSPLLIFYCHGLRHLLGAWFASTAFFVAVSAYKRRMYTHGSCSSNSSSSVLVVGSPSWVRQTDGPHHPLSIPCFSHSMKSAFTPASSFPCFPNSEHQYRQVHDGECRDHDVGHRRNSLIMMSKNFRSMCSCSSSSL